MKVLKVDHIGIAVKSIDAVKQLYGGLLGLSHAGNETVAEQKVTTAFFPIGDTEVELLDEAARNILSLSRRHLGSFAKLVAQGGGTRARRSPSRNRYSAARLPRHPRAGQQKTRDPQIAL